jgi:peroxiredoxin
MKRLMTWLMMAMATLSASAQDDPYKTEMDAFDLQGEAVIKEYRSLMQADPKGEKPATKLRIRQLADQLDSLAEAQLQLTKRIIRENKNNLIPVKYIADAMYQLGYEGLKEAMDPKAAYYNHPQLERARQLLVGYEKRAPGKPFMELTMKDLQDKEVRLSQWVGHGQYVLVDFWASWCGPCLREMPNVKACYEKYHEKGFGVVGVSLDQKKDDWEKAVKQIDMRWPQMSDLKGWQCAAAPLYGISSIPASVLLDAEGRIVAVDLRGKRLGAKLRELYGE